MEYRDFKEGEYIVNGSEHIRVFKKWMGDEDGYVYSMSKIPSSGGVFRQSFADFLLDNPVYVGDGKNG
jgi:hypothetical protein